MRAKNIMKNAKKNIQKTLFLSGLLISGGLLLACASKSEKAADSSVLPEGTPTPLVAITKDENDSLSCTPVPTVTENPELAEKDLFPVYEVHPDGIVTVDTAGVPKDEAPSAEDPIFVDSPLSVNSAEADRTELASFREEVFDVFDYTYAMDHPCYLMTRNEAHGFALYSSHDPGNDQTTEQSPKMRRCYLEDGVMNEEYLDTEDVFSAPFEDREGNIYAEIGRDPYSYDNDVKKMFIEKISPTGETIQKICVADYALPGASYFGYALIKTNVIALEFTCSDSASKAYLQFTIINIEDGKELVKINLYDSIVRGKGVITDEQYFIVQSDSYQRVYVFDAETYQLVNTIDTTKCRELAAFEWSLYDEPQKYGELTYNIDIKDGKVYFLRHSGIYVTDCLNTDFKMLLDGRKLKNFQNQIFNQSSLYVSDDEDFYILGVYFDEESATTLLRYVKDN